MKKCKVYFLTAILLLAVFSSFGSLNVKAEEVDAEKLNVLFVKDSVAPILLDEVEETTQKLEENGHVVSVDGTTVDVFNQDSSSLSDKQQKYSHENVGEHFDLVILGADFNNLNLNTEMSLVSFQKSGGTIVAESTFSMLMDETDGNYGDSLMLAVEGNIIQDASMSYNLNEKTYKLDILADKITKTIESNNPIKVLYDKKNPIAHTFKFKVNSTEPVSVFYSGNMGYNDNEVNLNAIKGADGYYSCVVHPSEANNGKQKLRIVVGNEVRYITLFKNGYGTYVDTTAPTNKINVDITPKDVIYLKAGSTDSQDLTASTTSTESLTWKQENLSGGVVNLIPNGKKATLNTSNSTIGSLFVYIEANGIQVSNRVQVNIWNMWANDNPILLPKGSTLSLDSLVNKGIVFSANIDESDFDNKSANSTNPNIVSVNNNTLVAEQVGETTMSITLQLGSRSYVLDGVKVQVTDEDNNGNNNGNNNEDNNKPWY